MNVMEIQASRGRYSVEFLDYVADLDSLLETNKYDAVIFDGQLVELKIISPELLAGIPSFALAANEVSKSFIPVDELLEWFSTIELNRGSMVLAIGGGTIQDIATFACSIFHRGVDWTFVPTTLLAQADSCVGGKCGINLSRKKNQIGLVYPPNKVVNINEFLMSLPNSEIQSGIGEILKMSLTGPNQFWGQFKQFIDSGAVTISDLVPLSLLAKKFVVEKDEFEQDYRRVLNYGHTFGHAFETASNYKIPHGIAVLLGMKIVHSLGVAWGETPRGLASEVNMYIDKVLGTNDYISLVNLDEVFAKIRSDKKVRNGEITFVILKDVGELVFIKRKLDSELELEIKSAFRGI
jgi:3-dehydroquinate synthase